MTLKIDISIHITIQKGSRAEEYAQCLFDDFAFCLYIYILLQLLTAFDENAAESISISEFQMFPLLSIFIFLRSAQ